MVGTLYNLYEINLSDLKFLKEYFQISLYTECFLGNVQVVGNGFERNTLIYISTLLALKSVLRSEVTTHNSQHASHKSQMRSHKSKCYIKF